MCHSCINQFALCGHFCFLGLFFFSHLKWRLKFQSNSSPKAHFQLNTVPIQPAARFFKIRVTTPEFHGGNERDSLTCQHNGSSCPQSETKTTEGRRVSASLMDFVRPCSVQFVITPFFFFCFFSLRCSLKANIHVLREPELPTPARASRNAILMPRSLQDGGCFG